VRPLRLKQIKLFTNNFSKDLLLGEGGYGWVYKGITHSGEVWAVKRSKNASEKSFEEFEKEVSRPVILPLSHILLVSIHLLSSGFLHIASCSLKHCEVDRIL
jgi:hypothetical protein